MGRHHRVGGSHNLFENQTLKDAVSQHIQERIPPKIFPPRTLVLSIHEKIVYRAGRSVANFNSFWGMLGFHIASLLYLYW